VRFNEKAEERRAQSRAFSYVYPPSRIPTRKASCINESELRNLTSLSVTIRDDVTKSTDGNGIMQIMCNVLRTRIMIITREFQSSHRSIVARSSCSRLLERFYAM